ncbi:PH domain-containing protein [Streptomyces sp. NPDC127084]|uniref:PH domain-containing protein n=1 Tax=Streptomyces sp. NPDC127084 TaxID=3347133 RepID=UPI0036536B26
MGEAAVAADPVADAEPVEDGGWRSLDRRSVLLTALVMTGVAGGAALPVFVGLTGALPWRQALGWVLGGAVLLIGAGTAADHVRWRRTRYRVGPERAELHTGLLLARRRSLARERIRSVDLTANPLQRVLGLVKVRIGTGEHTGDGQSTLELDPVTTAEGERLRRALLAHTAAAGAGTHTGGVLAAFDPRWIRYAPLSFVAPLLGGAAVGAVMQISEWFGVQGEVIDWTAERFADTPLLWAGAMIAAGVLVAGVVGALGLWIEMWFGYRLEREPGGTLRLRRGLLTARSLSIEERRLRGVELVEPLGVRLFGAARVDAVATGLANDEGDTHTDIKTLLPPVPRAVADRAVADVLREPTAPTNVPLTRHPRAARRRRLRWSLTCAMLPAAVLAGWGAALSDGDLPLHAAALCALLLPPLAVLLALDAYRNLGHAIGGPYLLARSGTLRRGTVALQRSGIIGWTLKQSWFQRRAGLLTLTATTAAGAGAYTVYDADEYEVLHFADRAVPGLLERFLEPPEGARVPGQPPGK